MEKVAAKPEILEILGVAKDPPAIILTPIKSNICLVSDFVKKFRMLIKNFKAAPILELQRCNCSQQCFCHLSELSF